MSALYSRNDVMSIGLHRNLIKRIKRSDPINEYINYNNERSDVRVRSVATV